MKGIADFDWALVWAHRLAWSDQSIASDPTPPWYRYRSWRRGHSRVDALSDTPGHLFSGSDRIELEKCLIHALGCGWDTVLLGQKLPHILRLSHDDLIDVRSKTRDDHTRLVGYLVSAGAVITSL